MTRGKGTGAARSSSRTQQGRPPAKAAPAAAQLEGNPALILCATLGLLVLFLLPLLGGGYSGWGYQFAFVALPLALISGLLASRTLPRLALYVLLLDLLGLLLLPLWLTPGQLLWYYVLQIPLGWCWCWILLHEAPQRARYLLPAAVFGALLSCLYGFFLWLGAGTLDYQINSSFGLHNAYGGYLLLAWPCAALCLLAARKTVSRLLWGLSLLTILATLVLTHSSGCLAALGLQLLVLALWYIAGRLHGRTKSTGAATELTSAQATDSRAALLVFAAALLVLAGLLALAPVRASLAHLLDFGGYSMQGRLRFWSAALQIFRAHPLLGTGPGSFAYVYPQYQRDWMYYSVDPHSWPLQLLAELGSVGLLILLAILAGLALWLRRLFRFSQGALGAGLAVVAVLGSLAHACIDFDYTFAASTMLLGVLLAFGSSMYGAAPQTAQQDEANAPEASKAPASGLAPFLSPAAAAPRWLAFACAALLLGTVYWGQRLTLERFVQDALSSIELNARLGSDPQAAGSSEAAQRHMALLRSAVRYDPHNFQTRYLLASDLSRGAGQSYQAALLLLDSSLRLNPRFTQALALRALMCSNKEEGSRYLERAIKLDPYNFPDNYFYWATLAPDEATRRARLLQGMQAIPVNDPVPPDHIRPQWHSLNPMFAQIWDELARLSTDPKEKALDKQRAEAFHKFLLKEREQALGQSQAPLHQEQEPKELRVPLDKGH